MVIRIKRGSKLFGKDLFSIFAKKGKLKGLSLGNIVTRAMSSRKTKRNTSLITSEPTRQEALLKRQRKLSSGRSSLISGSRVSGIRDTLG